MKKLYAISVQILFLFCVGFLAGQENIYYVTATGNASNDGLTEVAAWNIEHAFTTATEGMIVYIKSGVYSNVHCILQNNGTSQNKIKFIGYNNVPGDIIATNGATYNYNDSVNGNSMPLLKENRNPNKNGDGVAIDLNQKNYVVLENLQVQYYSRGVVAEGDGIDLNNISAIEQGNHNPADAKDLFGAFYDGWGIIAEGTGGTVKNCIVVNSGAQGITFQRSTNVVAENNEVHADNTVVNACDYYFFLGNATVGGLFKNTKVHRHQQLPHEGHGIVSKCNDAIGIINNVVDGFEIINTNLEVQFPNTRNNIYKNGTISDLLENANEPSKINLANGSHHNLFMNISLYKASITFSDWNDGLPGDVPNSSDNNTFINIQTNKGHSSIAFYYFGSNSNGGAENNVFYNCGFYGTSYVFEPNRANTNTSFVNCWFDGITGYKSGERGGASVHPLNVSFENCNWSNNSFTPPSGINNTIHQPNFVDAPNNDFTLLPESNLIDIGKDLSTININTIIDYNGLVGPNGLSYDIGPYEFKKSTVSMNSCTSPNPPEGLVPVGISVSEHDGNGPCNMMDNDLNPESRWSADGKGQWALFDLGTAQEFDQLQIAFYVGDQRSAYFDIEVSDDAQNWTGVLVGAQSSGNSLALEGFDLPSVQNARYIRYLGHGNSGAGDWNSLTEVRINKVSIPVAGIAVMPEALVLNVGETESPVAVISPNDATNQGVNWASSDIAVATVDQNGTVTGIAQGSATITATSDDGGFADTTVVTVQDNVCSGPSPDSGIAPAGISVSEHDGNEPCNLMDNDLGTRWSADGDGQWALFDLGTAQEFDQLQIAFYVGDDRSAYFDIEVSNDAQNWTGVLVGAQSSGNSLALEDFDLPSVQNARYIRYLGHGNSGAGDWNSLTEVRINKVSIPVAGIAVTPEALVLNVGETESPVAVISPNPTSNEIHLDIPSTSKYNAYSIFSVNGTLIKSGTVDPNHSNPSILVAGFKKGMYVLRLSDRQGNSAHLKLMKE